MWQLWGIVNSILQKNAFPQHMDEMLILGTVLPQIYSFMDEWTFNHTYKYPGYCHIISTRIGYAIIGHLEKYIKMSPYISSTEDHMRLSFQNIVLSFIRLFHILIACVIFGMVSLLKMCNSTIKVP